jgi:Spy/CpxP family protein refolding chaperone
MKNKVLLFLVFLLLISNAIVLYLYINGKHKSMDGKKRMLEKFKTEVGFTDAQAKQFEALREQQKENSKPLMDSIATLRKAYIGAIFANENKDSIREKYMKPIADKMLVMDMAMYNQLMEAKKICTPTQLNAYDSIVKKMMLRTPEKRRGEKK